MATETATLIKSTLQSASLERLLWTASSIGLKFLCSLFKLWCVLEFWTWNATRYKSLQLRSMFQLFHQESIGRQRSSTVESFTTGSLEFEKYNNSKLGTDLLHLHRFALENSTLRNFMSLFRQEFFGYILHLGLFRQAELAVPLCLVESSPVQKRRTIALVSQ